MLKQSYARLPAVHKREFTQNDINRPLEDYGKQVGVKVFFVFSLKKKKKHTKKNTSTGKEASHSYPIII